QPGRRRPRIFRCSRSVAGLKSGGSDRHIASPRSFYLSTPSSSPCILLAASPAGNASGVVRKRGEAGASGGGQTKLLARGGCGQGVPRRYYGRCVLERAHKL